ncbi:MAG TPA: TonB-dependent receptor [Prolixibacteraceae bacterium]|nr:TonB-dependent receptor [Prolixibacteraceae bacterium]
MRIIRKNLKVLILILSLLVGNMAMAQQLVLSGKVTDSSSGETLPGVNIVVKGTANGTVSDMDGGYTLRVNPGDIIQFSSVGYERQEITASNQGALSVALVPLDEQLDEVVIIGYGQVKKSDATGSVVAVNSEDFNKGAISSPQELLMGKSAGVVITTASGAPGANATIRIRGGSSLTASNDPLIIIDGIPLDNRNISGMGNPLASVNPNDIETFTVLKDASATAIYGSRASNGVILITTKRGKVGGALKITYDGNVSVASPIKYVDVYSGDEFRRMAWDHKELYDIAGFARLGQENTNWQKEIYRTAVSTDHNLSVVGSTKTMPYRVSVGQTIQNGILINTDMQRTTVSVGIDPTFLENHLKVTANAKGVNIDNNYGNTDAIGSAVNMDPTKPVMNGNTRYGGYYTWTTNDTPNGPQTGFGSNPVAQAKLRDNKANGKRFIGNVQVDYKFHMLPELRANLNMGIDYTKMKGHDNTDTIASWMRRGVWGQIRDYNGEYSNKVLDFYLNYTKDLDQLSSVIDLTGGYSWNHIRREEDRLQVSIVDALHPRVPASDSAATATESFLVSFFGRLNYTLLDKYLLTVTVREDGSSRFAKANRWGFFPSAAFAWKIKEEAFLRDVEALSELKLRLGWGITGQQNIQDNDYPALAQYRASLSGYSYQFGNIFLPTLRPNAYDENIKWESTTTKNIGLDFGFANNRISGSVDVYQRNTEDLLNRIAIPNGSNFSNVLLTNVGTLKNNGAELTLNVIPISTPDQSLSVGFNISYNKNEITKLLRTDDPNYIGIPTGGGMTSGNSQIHQVGSPLNSFFVNKQVYDASGRPIEGVYVDLSGEGGAINGIDKNKYTYKKPSPDYLMGLSARYSYKNFDISASSRISLGNYVYNSIASGASYDVRYALGYWANAPKFLEETKFVTRQPYSDYFVQNASFFKLDNVNAGYNIENIFSNVNARVSFTVQNLLTVTKYDGTDPEVNIGGDNPGVDNNFYPRPRTFIVGLNLTF